MFFYASKILNFLATPIIWILFLLLASIILKNQKKARICLISGVALLYLMGNGFLYNLVMRHWEVPAVSEEQISKSKPKGLILLGGLSFWDHNLNRVQFSRSSDRMMQTLALYKKGIGEKIIISGGSGSMAYPDDRESVFLQKYLLTIGIPAGDIIIESASKNTHENAKFTASILDSLGIRNDSFVLVTSGYHMKRSIACFQKYGIKVSPYTTDRYCGEFKYFFDHLFIPNAGTMVAWDVLMHEWIGYVSYWLAGYL